MLFNSLSFAWFLPVVFFVHWLLLKRNQRWQNLFLLVASYYFYACWDERFLLLLLFSTFLDYFTGLKMVQNPARKKAWFWLSICINAGFLGVFKYYNFFADSFADLLQTFGWQVSPWTLSVVLPVGISFYTFHGLSYVIDIYKNRIEPERNIVDYGLFVSFFPLLVAGPIERATHLLPQLKRRREFDYTRAVDGMRQLLWGLFKKVVIADGCAEYADLIFNASDLYSGSTLLLGAVFFSFQIYCDFSGYSDIALGVARLFGIELLRNFSFPYFSRDIAEFWRRWHISLSSWFRDYLYIPLGGSQGGLAKKIRNTCIIFLVSGFWHGANWTFIAWGAVNALYFMPLLLFNRNRNHLETVAQGRLFPGFRELIAVLGTFFLTVIAWIFFRSETLTQALEFIAGIFNKNLFRQPVINSALMWLFILFLVGIEWLGREQNHALQRFAWQWPRALRWLFYAFLVFLIGMYMQTNETPFIYFQF